MAAAVIRITGEFDDAALKKAEAALKKLGVEVANVEKTAAASLAEIGRSLQKTGDGMADFGKKWSTRVTAPLAAIGAVSLKVAGDFEQTMNVLQVNANASGKEMEKLRDQAIEFGQKTVFSAGESAQAMLELSKGGLSAAAISGGALSSTLALAATEGMALDEAATIVVQSMNTFGLSAKSTGKVVDVLAAGAVASTAGVQDLAAGLKYVGSTANQFKIGVGESVTALAALNNAGLDSTTAGTSLNRFFLGLVGTTKKARTAIKDMGFEFFDANGQMRPMKDIIGELEQGLKGLSDQDRAQTLKTIFGVEGMRAGNILLEQGVAGYEKLSKEIDKNGVAQEMADARMKGLKGSLEQLKGSLETAAIQIGTIMAPVVQDLAKFVQGLVDAFGSLPEPMQRFIIIAATVVAAIGPVVFVIGKVTSGIGSMLLAFSKVPGIISTVMAAAQGLFTFLMAHPFVLIAAAVIALAVVIYKNWDSIKEFLFTVFNAIKEFTLAIWNGIKDFFIGYLNFYKEIFTIAFNAVETLIKTSWQFISGFASEIWNAIKDTVVGAIDTLKGGVTNGLNGIKTVFTNIFNGIKNFVGDVMDGIMNTVKGAINFVIRGVNTLIGGLNKINFSFPSWVPGIGGKSFGISIPTIPALAEGGIVTQPTLALIGEAGPEAVVPLSSPQARGVGGVNIAAGAVQININGPVDQGSLSSIEQIVDQALRRLAREVSYA